MPPLKTPEFPHGASEWPPQLSRRAFARLAAASAALAGSNGCTRQPLEKIVPYVRQPEFSASGRPLYFATAMVLDGLARGILVQSENGRPIKIEGHPAHPASLGGTDVFMQGAVLDLYDPARLQSVRHRGEIATWGAFDAVLRDRFALGGVRILTEKTASPTWIRQVDLLRARYPDLRWHHYDPLDAATLSGATSAPGISPEIFDDADIVVALDADLFGEGPAKLALARRWSKRRRVWETDRMIKLYVAEPTPTVTGAVADHRLPIRASDIGRLALELAAAVRGESTESSWVRGAAEALRSKKGFIVVGDRQAPEVHEALQEWKPPATPRVDFGLPEGLVSLVEAMEAGEVESLLILGGDPVRNAPADLGLAHALEKTGFSAHASLFPDVTSKHTDWSLPQSHFLETWSDARAFTGDATIVQPLIRPLYDTRSAHEVLAAVSSPGVPSGRELVRDRWSALSEEAWRRALSEGLVPVAADSEGPSRDPHEESLTFSSPFAEGELEVDFRADPSLHDGRFAPNGWLQELPKPFTKLSWGNAVLMSPGTARRLGLRNEDVVRLRRGDRFVEGPVMVQPGQADNTVTLHLGHGGRFGFDAYPLRSREAFWFGGVALERTGRRATLVSTQDHQNMLGRHLVRHASLADYRSDPSIIAAMGHPPTPDETLYPPGPLPQSDYQWGMTIDLNTCFGCNACVIACQAENNIPVVGREQVAMGREMHWIRIDTYFEQKATNPRIHFQPVPCMHCENAPCEVVCPVAATVHDSEGLNVQVYNRCIGTRYCSNNCPYKVRRFNFLDYTHPLTASQKLQRNPQVTVRERGVMEKCTYCVQRISRVRIEAKKAMRPIRDGEVVPACAQACPAEAITFGDQSDPNTRVSRQKALPLNYAMLAETNVRPRTTYLGKVTPE